MKKTILSLALSLPCILFAQQKADSVVTLQPVELKVHFKKQSLLSITAATHSLNTDNIQQQQSTSLVSAINTVAGLRMEERSPGSYRLAMRGSLIRSPFGIRNTKIYIDEFPLTDAGGNTYLNLIDPASVYQINVLKGPDGSLYGANSGGVIRITPQGFNPVINKTEINLLGGSYGLFQQQFGLQRKINDKYQFSINQSFVRSDGYRENSALNKKSFQTSHVWDYNPTSQLRLYAFYTDISYQTPGGLTLQQYEENPKQSRPAAGPNPSAKDQKAAIYNKTFFSGIAHSKQINSNLSHHMSIYGSITDFENPFITNYEYRDEKNLGARTYLSWNSNQQRVQMQLGAEATLGWNSIANYDNDKGTATNLQAEDDLDNQTWNIFYRTQIELLTNWNIEGSLGVNGNRIVYHKYYPLNEKGSINFRTEWMPRVATNYVLDNMSWRLSFAKGYSAPTVAEVRSSDNIINTALQAESGNNYEIGYKFKSNNQRFIFDIAAYNYKMKNGIMRQVNEQGIEFYDNVGEMNQKGLEGTMWLHLPLNSGIIKNITFQTALTYNHYRFGNYQETTQNLKGNKITAVPDFITTNTFIIDLPKSFKLNLYYNHTSTIPLNDANTVFASSYNLVQTKLLWNTNIQQKVGLEIYFGIDNLLNEKYSLGNDINAFGGRYFNAAPNRNFYIGTKITLK